VVSVNEKHVHQDHLPAMSHKLTLQPIVRRNRPNASGEVPVYYKIIVDGKPVEITTKQYVSADQWSSERGPIKGKTEAVNTYLDNLQTRLKKIFNQLEEKGGRGKYHRPENQECIFGQERAAQNDLRSLCLS